MKTDLQGQAVIYYNMADAHMEMNENEKAIKCLTHSLELHQQNGDAIGQATCHDRLGTIYMQAHNRQQGKLHFQRLKEIQNQVGPGKLSDKVSSKETRQKLKREAMWHAVYQHLPFMKKCQ